MVPRWRLSCSAAHQIGRPALHTGFGNYSQVTYQPTYQVPSSYTQPLHRLSRCPSTKPTGWHLSWQEFQRLCLRAWPSTVPCTTNNLPSLPGTSDRGFVMSPDANLEGWPAHEQGRRGGALPGSGTEAQWLEAERHRDASIALKDLKC